ncbi:MAG TPA: imidazole glycerol phosphate synthase subunit HisH [Methanospirillum sp.]|uniref:imidazole glycerol phosphate synthase subunit HisH n=1 Tax=Methanospirillum sp. TaxID=45200 RepID=UPI002B8B3605|nr:imidazole glycerol phosphate synthase subunit HisH [Methanospirillum sp.]HWQ64271.1 imidazole glycerol phosphate synthase subunit HisH [Methanospirillum sp.]
MSKIAIVDYGLGNLRSVSKALEKVGGNVSITGNLDEIRAADGIILPGVGAFHEGMARLSDLQTALLEAQGQVPVLGICLGMQMLMDFSEEHGLSAGLGLIPGTVRRFKRTPGCKIPHMGWNQVSLSQPDDPLYTGIPDGSFFYFVHSFWADTPGQYRVTSTEYINPFASSIRNGTVWGTQFHPEKSGEAGLQILRNYIGMI